MAGIMERLGVRRAEESRDYVEHKGQFHLHGLLTEQRHPRTWNLGFTLPADIAGGLRQILSVERDIERRLEELAGDPAPLEQAAASIAAAVAAGRRIYIYGCGATGRLAKQMESSLWRPFWRRLRRHPRWGALSASLPAQIEDLLVGEMTGADRALVSSLEGFEDLMLVGELQLEDHGIRRGDIVICVTEGGETSSVIGTALAALTQYGELDEASRAEARQRLYFIYNNPAEVLRPFERSARVLDEPGITKINLSTGPQAIAGSTRMQATTIETFVLGVILEEAIARLLRAHLTGAELAELGFAPNAGMVERLAGWRSIRAAVDAAPAALARLTELESATYEQGHFATYFARRALITVFIDGTERSPTFRLHPLDRVQDPERRCWVQVWTEGRDAASAWRNFLGRPFRGLDAALYGAPLAERVADPYLRRAALSSLADAGGDQEQAYDFSFSEANLARRGPQAGDLGVLVLFDEEARELEDPASSFHRFRALLRERDARLALIRVSSTEPPAPAPAECRAGGEIEIVVGLGGVEDPLDLRRHIALKILLNAHSSATMVRLGRVVGNTMTNVSPSNLKLIGRATFLILSHVNDILSRVPWGVASGACERLTFAEANAILFDAIAWVRERGLGQTAEVGLSIIRVLESLRRGVPLGWEQASEILAGEGLAAFLLRLDPSLARRGPSGQDAGGGGIV